MIKFIKKYIIYYYKNEKVLLSFLAAAIVVLIFLKIMMPSFSVKIVYNPEMETKIREAINSLEETSSIVNELELEINNRLNRIEDLKLEMQFYDELVSEGESKVEAMRNFFEETYYKEQKKENVKAIVVNALIGIISGVIVGVWIAPYIKKKLSKKR